MAADPTRRRAGAIARRNPPDVFTVAFELSRITDRILLLHVGRAATVLEVINSLPAHELILDAAKVYPQVRELVDEERASVEELVEFLPWVVFGPSRVALTG